MSWKVLELFGVFTADEGNEIRDRAGQRESPGDGNWIDCDEGAVPVKESVKKR